MATAIDVRRRRESGQGSLERVGAMVLVGVIIAAIYFVVNGGSVTPQIAKAWCMITSAGQTDCSQDPTANPKLPTEPCTVDESGHKASLKGAVVLAIEGNRALIVEELSDGTYKVTMVDGAKVGAEGGFGWDARLEVNGTRWGSDMYAGGGVYLDGSVSQVWNVSSDKELANLVNYARFSDVSDGVAGGLSGVVKWIGDKVGVVETPRDPDSTIITGGIGAQGSAGITAWIGGGELAGALGANVGIEIKADGTKTYYLGGGGTLKLGGAISIVHGYLGGEAATRMMVDVDESGTPVAVRFETNVVTDGKRTVYTDTMPLTSDADREAFNDFVAEAAGATGLSTDYPATERWAQMMKDRGQQTKLDYNTNGLDVKAVASGKWIGEVGLEGSFAMPHSDLVSAEYFDGQNWVPWSACMGG